MPMAISRILSRDGDVDEEFNTLFFANRAENITLSIKSRMQSGSNSAG
jgi:hypothetical protein